MRRGLMWAGFLALGCGPGDTTPPGYAPQPLEDAQAPADIVRGVDAGPDAAPSPDATPARGAALSGMWGMRLETTAVTEIPFVGQSVDVQVALARVTFSGEPLDAQASLTTCGVRITSSQAAVEQILPEAFVSALGVAIRPFSYDPVTGRFEAPRFVEVRGARLDAPETDALPTSAEDPRVFDQDADGKPGMTVRVQGLIDGEVYVVQRGANAFSGARVEGEATAPTRFEGNVVWQSEQTVVGADNRVLEMSLPSRPSEDVAQQRVVLVRLADDAGCDAVRAALEPTAP